MEPKNLKPITCMMSVSSNCGFAKSRMLWMESNFYKKLLINFTEVGVDRLDFSIDRSLSQVLHGNKFDSFQLL
jgi:hypothetical protein